MSNENAVDDRIAELLDSESDRGCVIVGCAILDESLERLLATHFRAQSNASNAVVASLLTDGFAPIKNLAVRTKLAFALGLIDNPTRLAIDALRRAIRNNFAHKTDFKLTDDDVRTVRQHFDGTEWHQHIQKLVDDHKAIWHLAGKTAARMSLMFTIVALEENLEKAIARLRDQQNGSGSST